MPARSATRAFQLLRVIDWPPGYVSAEAGGAVTDLRVDQRVQDERTIVAVEGEVDLGTAPRLREVLDEVVRSGRRSVVIDITGVGFIDSTGLGVLLGCLRRLKERDGTLALTGVQPAVERVFTITGLDRVFTITGLDRTGAD